MKKPILLLGVMLFALVSTWMSCNTDSSREANSSGNSSDTSYLLLSQLAFRSYILDSTANIEDARALYRTAQIEDYELAKHLSIEPNNSGARHNQQIPRKETASIFPMNNNLLASMMYRGKVDLCPCPNSNDLCPCPGLNVKVLFATSSEAHVEVDNKPLDKSTIAGTGGAKWKSFALDQSQDRTFTLTIRSDFIGKGTKATYTIPMEIKEGRLYVRKF